MGLSISYHQIVIQQTLALGVDIEGIDMVLITYNMEEMGHSGKRTFNTRKNLYGDGYEASDWKEITVH